jgi:hypothetical protein
MKCASVYFSEYLFAYTVSISLLLGARSYLPFNFRSNCLAGTAPGGKGIEHDYFLSLGIEFVVGCLGSLGQLGAGCAVQDNLLVLILAVVEKG